MAISVVSLKLSQLQSLQLDGSHVDGVPVVPGALPPNFIIEEAVAALEQGKSIRWCSPFVFIDNSPGRIVGTGGFKGPPVRWRVEIGYGVAEPLRGNGFATAAVRELLQLAFSEPDVREVYAETATDNGPSRRVVEKTGFRHAGRRATERDGTVDQWLRVR